MPKIYLTPGEPAGIGPDIAIQALQSDQGITIVADKNLILERAQRLDLPPPQNILHVPLSAPVIAGQLNLQNAAYVLKCLEIASTHCLKENASLVTGPIQKNILIEAGIPFVGHTEFLQNFCHVRKTVMLFVGENFKVALATTHLPLREVSDAITKELLTETLQVLRDDLKKYFKINSPKILVAGLNPHAGESGQLGTEEIKIIGPVIEKFQNEGWEIRGPLSADTLFSEKNLKSCDAILAMYHDQALPVVKQMSFGNAVNVTLGLPFVRASVDHGTALDIAGTGKADASSLKKAIEMARVLSSD